MTDGQSALGVVASLLAFVIIIFQLVQSFMRGYVEASTTIGFHTTKYEHDRETNPGVFWFSIAVGGVVAACALYCAACFFFHVEPWPFSELHQSLTFPD